MSVIAFDPAARVEFLAAVTFYEACESGLGKRFREIVELQVADISAMPFRFRILHSRFRRCLIPKFPFYLVFIIEPSLILIVAVAHTKRKPGYWNERIENIDES